jgi:hypothetical protein
MATVNDMLQAALSVPLPPQAADTGVSLPTLDQQVAAGLPDPKQLSVTTVSEAKKSQLYQMSAGIGNQAGAASMSDLEADLRSLSNFDLILKYGPAAERLISARTTAGTDFRDDQALNTRTPSMVSGDVISGVGGGLVNAFGGLAALGLGAVNDQAGTWAAQQLQSGNEWLEANQSDTLNARRRTVRAETALDKRDSDAQYELDLKENGQFVAGTRRVGRDIADAIGNNLSDPTTFIQGTSDAAGSLLAGGPISKALGAVGAPILGASRALGAGETAVARLATVGQRVAMPISIGAIEGGGAYQSTASDVMSQSFEDLQKNSPSYRDLVASGSTPEQARTELANRAALMAAAIQAPIGAATGALVSRFETSPFTVPSLGSAVGSLARETVEEGVQSGAGQLAQNYSIQNQVDPTQDLSEGVGEQIGTGALFGFSSAGAVQAPGVAARATAAAGELAVRGLRNTAGSLLERGRRVIEANEAASPVADDAVLQEAQVAQTQAPETAAAIAAAIDASPAAPEAKAQATAYVDSMMQKLSITSEELIDPSFSPELSAALEGTTNRVDAMRRLANVMENSPDDSKDQLDAGYRLLDLNRTVEDFLYQEAGALNDLAPDSEANQLALKYERLVANLGNTVKTGQALARILSKINASSEDGAIQDVTDESLATPEGQQNVKNAIAVAQVNPDKGNLQANEQILYQASQGRLNLSENEATALRASIALLREKKRAADEQARLGLRPIDVVSNEIQTDKKDPNAGKKSAAQYTNEILSAYRSGNRDLASTRLADFGMFVQHMQNKVQALNTHFASGDPNGPAVAYEALNPNTRQWYQSTEGLRVRPASANSVEFAQKVGLEAQTLANVFNGLADALPGLGDRIHVATVSLDSRLDGPAQVVADEFRSRKRSVSTSPVDAVVDSVPETVTEVAVEAAGNTTAEIVQDVQSVPVKSDNSVKTEPEVIETTPITKPEPITNKEWMKGDLRQIRPDDGRARVIDGPTSITYDRIGDLVKVNIITTKKEGRGQGSARRALNTLVEMTDASGLRMQLDVAEQDTGTDKQRLMDFYSSVGFRQQDNTDTMNRDVGGVVAPEPVREGLDAVYPNLIGGNKNYFKQAYTLPAEPKTHITGSDAPLAFVDSILSSSQQFSRHLGGSLNRDYDTRVAVAYGDVMGIGEELKKVMSNNLKKFLNTPYSKTETRTRGELLAQDAEITTSRGTTFRGSNLVRTPEGKALNIADVVNGQLTYNDGLVETAVLAGLQWMINANQYGQDLDEQAIADYVGIPVERVTPDLMYQMNMGMSLVEAKQSLAQKIQTYWGVSSNRNTPEGYVRGIPESVAAEVLRAMEATPILTVETVTVGAEYGLATPKTIDRYVVSFVSEENPITEFPDAIERAVMVEPEVVNFIGEDAIPPVAQRQMNNPMVENTDEQKTALSNEQSTKFYVNPYMLNLYAGLGVENIQQLFGAGNSTDRVLNERHASSVEGKNRTIAAGYNHLMAVVNEVENHAQHNGLPLEQVPIRYGYNMSRVGRMQMLGKYNPQSTKLVREAILPTRSTVDLSGNNQAHTDAFMLATAQHMGIKVHNMSVASAIAKLDAMLKGSLNPLLDLADSLNSGNHVLDGEEVQRLKDGFANAGADLTPGSLHALSEYARFRNDPNKSEFTTSLYLEADGKTNGPINAMGLFTLGKFSEEFLFNLGKGGVFFGPRKTSNEHTEFQDSKDLYQATTDALAVSLGLQREMLRQDPYGTDQTNRLLSLMSTFLPDLNFDETQADADNGGLELKRGIAKNPLTITIYGSGAMGIAGNLVDTLSTKMYERMSDAASAMASDKTLTLAQAMFPGQPNADVLFASMSNAFEELTTFVAKRQFDGSLKFLAGEIVDTRKGLNPVTFALTPNEYKNLQQNMLELFVAPLRQAIESTVGSSLLNAVTGVRKATQVQSIFQQYAFKSMVAEAIEIKKRDPSYREGDFLSQAELESINRRINELSPIIDTGTQRFYIAGSSRADIPSQEFGRALDGTMRTDGFVYGPSNAGVAGIPFLTIGMGDGKMMQLLANQEDVTGTLKIFDGMNVPLDKINEYSLAANKAVYDSWQGNPMREVLKSYAHFAERATLDENTPAEMIEDLKTALFGFGKLEFDLTPEILMGEIEGLTFKLEQAADSVDARHAVMAATAMSFDQMAAAGSPFINTGEALPEGVTNEELVAILNDKYEKARVGESITPAQVAEDTTGILENVEAPTTEGISKELSSVGRAHRTGARVLSYTALQNLSRMVKMTDSQKVIFGEIMRSMAAKQYKVVYGNAEQVQAYQLDTNSVIPNHAEQGNVHGYTVIRDQTIYLIDPTTETLVHELVHASTFEKVHGYYDGQSTDAEVASAIGRIEELMNVFLQQTNSTPEYQNARSSILSAQTNPTLLEAESRALALNEFMAWSLTNEALTDQLKAKKVPTIVKLAKDAVKFIKQLIWGRKKAPVSGDDALSNLQFNTGIVIRSQPTVATTYADVVAYQNSWYGDSDRLTKLKQAFNNKVAQYLRQPLRQGVTAPKVAVSDAIMASARLAMSVNANGFPMTMQESSTFRSIVSALATEAQIDASAMAQIQDLYQHVTKTLRVENSMMDPQGNDPNDRYQAQQKFDVVMGNFLVEKDAKGRSSLLPVFVGLAMTNEPMRNALAQLELPNRLKADGRTIDAFLNNTGNAVMDNLTKRLSGQGVRAKNVQDALDNLLLHIQEVAQDDQTFLDQYAGKAGGIMDRANSYIVDSVSRLSNATIARADGVIAKTNSKTVRALANVTRLTASLVTEQNSEKVAQSTMELLNKANIWRPMHDIINDLIGRTENNSSIYDMIKTVRSMVQQDRQQFREHLPGVIADKFTRKLGDNEWAALHSTLGKTDLASLVQGRKAADVLQMLSDPTAMDSEIISLESIIQNDVGSSWPLYQSKMNQLANYMANGQAGRNLLRNAYAISRLFGEKRPGRWKPPTQQVIDAIDQLVSLYAVQALPNATKDIVASLAQTEIEGMTFSLSYLVGQRAEELRKTATDRAKVNQYKGYIPTMNQPGVQLLVADDLEYSNLVARSFVRVADYVGSTADRTSARKGYYFSPVSGRATYNQGIFQNVRHTTSGVDAVTGFTHDNLIAGRITDSQAVRRAAMALANETATDEPLLPVYDENGVAVAFERSVNPARLTALNPDTHFAKMVGVWRGRQVEEAKAQFFNEKLIDSLKAQYDRDMMESSDNQRQYVDLLASQKDPTLRDSVALFSPETQAYIRKVFGANFYVRRDMLNDAIGYRAASVGDLWTGNTRWSDETIRTMKELALGVFGNKAYRYVVEGERLIQNFVGDAKTIIVVKSVVVPMSNLIANMYQLVGRGVPLLHLARSLPKKTVEINSYVETQLKKIRLEADLRAAEGDVVRTRKLTAEIQSINDAHRRLSIWPLLEAGEFTAISDVNLTPDDVELTSGKLNAYIERLVDKLPDSVRTAGRYALITKDTALYQGLAKTIQYGDFIAKAVLYDDLTIRQGRTPEYALGRVSEEFVNYDRLPGRFRGYIESMGLLWFWNFKIRSVKTAVSMIRNNPLHSFLATVAPAPTMFGSVGIPIEDNLFAKMADGSLDYSVGLGQAFRAPLLNPWINLVE